MRLRSVALLGLVTATVFVTACGTDAATAPDKPDGVALSVQDCGLGGIQCDAIWMAIQHLQSHPAAGCQEIGNSAMARYNDQSGNIGFAPGNVPGSTDYAYVDMQPGSSFSGWVPANGMIWMLPAAFTTGPLDLAATIAHEEGGHQSGMDGFGHNTGVGEMWARVCTGEN